MSWDTLLYVACILIVITLFLDIWKPHFVREGFMTGVGSNPFVTTYFPRRGDISFHEEEAGYIQDPRHVRGYADVQALGVNHDFCRLLIPKGSKDENGAFFACALGGTENLSSTSFKTQTVAQGFKTSRDDYMQDIDKDGRTDYCAILKVPGQGWQPRCYRALQTNFDTRTVIDANPPKDIAEILYFYEGILFWFRFIDDMKDYGENLHLYASGNIQIDEAKVKPLPSQLLNDITDTNDRIQVSEGLRFNGLDQFLRLGDSSDMTFGRKITLTTMRAICFWVFFDDFTNNAHILDFGNGAGQDNVFIGIIGKGDQTMSNSSDVSVSSICKSDHLNVLPHSPQSAELRHNVPLKRSTLGSNSVSIPNTDSPSGAQPVEELRPVDLMLSTSANVDEYICPGQQELPRNLPPLKPLTRNRIRAVPETATLLYEIWNGKQRLEHIKVQGAFKKKVWTHICITTASEGGVRPAVQVWIDGKQKAENPDGYLPQSSVTSNNYIGKSNWERQESLYENKPELFKGSIFDLRGYNQGVSNDKLKKTIIWGKKRLGI